MNEIIRDAPFGQLLRYVTRNRVLLYPEERPDFECPTCYAEEKADSQEKSNKKHKLNNQDAPVAASDSNANLEPVADPLPPAELEKTASNTADIEKAESSRTSNSSAPSDLQRIATVGSHLERSQSKPWTRERFEAEEAALQMRKTQSLRVVPTKTADGTILVDWYTNDDPANPQNWTQTKKAWTAFLVCLYTFVVYASSSIYVPSEGLVMERFGVGDFKAALGLALYVLGYGIGPLIFAPLSEVPQFGRNVPYITTFALFTILALPASLVDNLGGLLVLRFLLGFFGSPCLANGGATMQDMYSLLYIPYPLAMWVVAAFAAPALGPLLSGFAVYAENWRWSQWEVLWMAGPVFLLFLFFLPETQPTTILLHRAARLRKASGNPLIRTRTEIDRKDLTIGAVVIDAIIKPIEITIKDPAILFVNLYTALIYGIYYSFFEVFPLVYPVLYGFNVGETSIVFVCIIVGCFIAVLIHFSYLNWYLIPDIMKNGLREQEHRLVPAIFASVGPPIGLFIFGWTARESIHWIVSVIGLTIYAASVFIMMQGIFTYVPMSYPQYAASLFAGNDFFRSLFAFGAVLFGRPMYIYLGVAKGVSLLGGLSVMGVVGMWALWHFGAKLRAKSRFAVSD